MVFLDILKCLFGFFYSLFVRYPTLSESNPLPIRRSTLLDNHCVLLSPPSLDFEIQGLFLKRQQEVSRIYARKNCSEVLTPAKMWSSILTGPKKGNFEEMLKRNTCEFVDQLAGNLKPLMENFMGGGGAASPGTWAELKNGIATDIVKVLPLHIELSYAYTEKALDMETEIRTKMQGLSPAAFEGVLHPVFEEDELKLILVGMVLGLAVGVLQLFVMF